MHINFVGGYACSQCNQWHLSVPVWEIRQMVVVESERHLEVGTGKAGQVVSLSLWIQGKWFTNNA